MKFWVHIMLEISPLSAKLSVSRTLLHGVGNFYEFNEEILTHNTINVVCMWTP
jgi:hypothetical protein